ncbi:dna partial [Plasmopara halstedii]|uniref:Dna partial n=1 Tax=Plasmopara halstedii TaxID=4781 RepID=A0A0P1ASV6_PLAHL|nr:dna partial [Plasmopara halstedii]CEG44380.1 dna partial [Plasmopara halstedii]
MISRTPITDDLALFEEHKALSEHFSPAHLGVQVLDSSKHIMNTVMCLAEDIVAKTWYQDTDSMHIDYDAVSRLEDAFRQKYNKELIGKQMGQFHVDFDLKRSEGNIYAKESIFLDVKASHQSFLKMIPTTNIWNSITVRN